MGNPLRIIPLMEIKNDTLIKGIRKEGVRVVGDPREQALNYFRQGAEELILLDAVASLYQRNHLAEITSRIAKEVFIPITVGGGLRTVGDVHTILRKGADKVAINTHAVERPELISEVAEIFGCQCMVLQIDAKQHEDGWEVYVDNGREPANKDVIEWAKQGVELGAGEVLITAVDRDGTRQGYDIELVRSITEAVNVPVIACGGMGTPEHVYQAVQETRIDGIAMANYLHVQQHTVGNLKDSLLEMGIEVRKT